MEKADAASIPIGRDASRIKAGAVVLNDDAQGIRIAPHQNLGMRGMSMLYYVYQQFPDRLEENDPKIIIERFFLAVVVEPGADALLLLNLAGEPFNGRDQSQLIDHGRALLHR